MDYLLMAIIGWVGSGWQNTDDGWPTGCPMCRQIVGVISAIILSRVLAPVVPADAGLLGTVVVCFFGGSFGASLIGGLVGMMKGK
jgi:hypothetical protein